MGYTIKHQDDFQRTGKWSLARRSLGISCFGMNIATLAPGATVTPHDETESDQEEVFIVLEGKVKAVIDGEESPAPAGTFVRVDPESFRTLVNESEEPATILIVSAPRTSGYQPPDWA